MTGAERVSILAGDMGIVLTLHSAGPDAYGEDRETYAYTITHGRNVEQGADLRTGVGHHSSPAEMLPVLAGFLSAYGEAYRANHLSWSESYADIPGWLQEACYLNSDELDMLQMNAEGEL